MSDKKPVEFWIQNPQYEICTATRVSAFDSEVNPQITEEVHVVEYSAYQNALLEAIAAHGESAELLETNEMLSRKLKKVMDALEFIANEGNHRAQAVLKEIKNETK